jgi:integrase
VKYEKWPKLQKHSNGFYYAYYERERFSLKTKLFTRAKEKFDKLVKGENPNLKPLLFSKAVDAYLAKGTGHLAPKTLERYKYCLETFLVPFFEHVSITRIKVKEVREYLQSRKVCANTLLKDLTALSALLAWCVGEGYLEYNPCRQLERKHKPSPRKLKRPGFTPSEEQLNLVAKQIKHPRAKLFFWALATCGARINELRQANVSDLDQDTGWLYVTRKGGKRDVVFLDDRVVNLLKADLKKRDEVKPDDPLFLNRYGTRMLSIKRSLLFACKRAEVPHMGHHALRHGFVSIAHERGQSLEDIRAMAGHAPGSRMTEDIYLEIKKQLLGKAARSLQIGEVIKK